MSELIEFDGKTMKFNFHQGQIKAWDSLKRFVCVFSGTQGGKTTFGPPWLWRELRGPGDYMVITPTFRESRFPLGRIRASKT
jgi:hypothetical protein